MRICQQLKPEKPRTRSHTTQRLSKASVMASSSHPQHRMLAKTTATPFLTRSAPWSNFVVYTSRFDTRTWSDVNPGAQHGSIYHRSKVPFYGPSLLPTRQTSKTMCSVQRVCLGTTSRFKGPTRVCHAWPGAWWCQDLSMSSKVSFLIHSPWSRARV